MGDCLAAKKAIEPFDLNQSPDQLLVVAAAAAVGGGGGELPLGKKDRKWWC